MTDMENVHIPVLLQETLEDLALNPTDVVVDATAGGGGHAKAIANILNDRGVLVALDQDEDALMRVTQALHDVAPRVYTIQSNFADMRHALTHAGISQIDKILFDLGLSTNQLELSGRGFSFKRDEPLLMTMNKQGALTAYEIVNSYEETELARYIFEYGEERYSRRIAKALVEARKKKTIETSKELADIVFHSVPRGYQTGRIHPATRTFQALRMVVNDELQVLTHALHEAWDLLAPHGRITVISFHSLEDRIVKQYFASLVREDVAELPHRKPLTASPDEIKINPKSRSAKLRTIIKT